ncbi:MULTISPECIES: Holliday junction branch migration protein RuvA [unclassified Methanoregula]|uniref:Holliday junction branch migration protein RuvA n=1 Tax=unclassified Methanoregula TaxID=2649730 RepID=UPI0009D02333|nr:MULTISPECIES: Holliday junction branch migration protein RuvA [unclassified Methanoregula]OPX62895.1 MAG: Holliday junction DNA helicase RuvA [Methanoregula sp. PtaB.Bin085]OPY35332.1 MAG: Holliday junction DNA helicase RuvA [Methanoregula sp. PtaU1.Bin006]
MIARLSGTMVLAGDRWVIIDVHGVGYQVQVTQPALRRLADTREPVTLFTHLVVREDAVTLYGFPHQSELEMFRILIGVTGIGPQIAMNLLSRIGIEEFAIAILNDDEKTLTRIPGIGPKSAKRLILELRDKMKKVGETIVRGETKDSMAIHDAVSALVSLGFAEKESRDAVNAAAPEHGSSTVQGLIKAALAKLKER